MSEQSRELHHVIYRSCTADGAVWCESRSPSEVTKAHRELPKENRGPLLRQQVYIVTEEWEPWKPTAADVHLHKWEHDPVRSLWVCSTCGGTTYPMAAS